MLKLVALTFLVLVAFVLVLAASKPSAFRVERSTLVLCSPERISSLVDNFHYWKLWSPWARLDPTMAVYYAGPPSGVGAVYEWQGNRKVGKGRMEVLEAHAQRTLIQIDFFRPIRSSNKAEFTFTPESKGTRVTWTLYGPTRYLSKVMSVFTSMDRLLGKDFEKGLSALKEVAENDSASPTIVQRLAV